MLLSFPRSTHHKVVWLLGEVRLDAADEVRVARRHLLNEVGERVLELCAQRGSFAVGLCVGVRMRVVECVLL